MKVKTTEKGQADYIRPCPYCNTAMHRYNREYAGLDEGYYMQCPTCEAAGKTGYTIDLAIEAWNNETIEVF